jgi:hypothetical protein
MIRRTAALFLAMVFTSGCATIVHGSQQDIRVVSNPAGAVVRVNLNNTATATPGVVALRRKEIGYILTFEKEGYKPVEVSLRRTVSGWQFGNIIFGGIIGMVIDFSNGSAYKLTPAEAEVILEETNVAKGKPEKDDVLVFVDMEMLPGSIRAGEQTI